MIGFPPRSQARMTSAASEEEWTHKTARAQRTLKRDQFSGWPPLEQMSGLDWITLKGKETRREATGLACVAFDAKPSVSRGKKNSRPGQDGCRRAKRVRSDEPRRQDAAQTFDPPPPNDRTAVKARRSGSVRQADRRQGPSQQVLYLSN